MKYTYACVLPVHIGITASQFKRSIESTVDQCGSLISVYVVFDGPVVQPIRDQANALAKQLRNFKLITTEQNQGLPSALNLAISHVREDYIFRMDADDENLPNRMENTIHCIERDHFDLIGGNILERYRSKAKVKAVPYDTLRLPQKIGYRNPFNHPTVCFSRSAFYECGGYNPKDKGFEDYGLWLRFNSARKNMGNVDENWIVSDYDRSLIRRRTGPQYAYNEASFLIRNLFDGHLKIWHVPYWVLIRLPSRFAPSCLTHFIYQHFR